MKSGLIIYGLDRPLSGISRYAVELARALGGLSDGPELVRLMTGRADRLGTNNGGGTTSLRGCGRLPGLMTVGNVAFRQAAQRLNLDVIHDPTGLTPFLFGAGRARTVVTVHDVFAWSIPGHSTLADTLIYRHWLPHMLPRVDAIITDSAASKLDIVRYLNIPADRIRVVDLGVSSRCRPADSSEQAQVRAQHGLPSSYVLSVGSVEPRKNLDRLLRAYDRLWQSGEHWPLVVVGAERWRHSEITETVNELELERRAIFTGYVSDEDLPAIYSGADLFVFPSLYEGFGLPPLEAMACGTPVVCSNTSSLPEVVGDAAIMVDPYDVEALAEAMRRVLSDPALADDLRRRGLDRAAGFTWERTARETVEVYREVLS